MGVEGEDGGGFTREFWKLLSIEMKSAHFEGENCTIFWG